MLPADTAIAPCGEWVSCTDTAADTVGVDTPSGTDTVPDVVVMPIVGPEVWRFSSAADTAGLLCELDKSKVLAECEEVSPSAWEKGWIEWSSGFLDEIVSLAVGRMGAIGEGEPSWNHFLPWSLGLVSNLVSSQKEVNW